MATQARFAIAYFLPWGCLCPRPTRAAWAQPRNTRTMPILLPHLPLPQTYAAWPVWSDSTTQTALPADAEEGGRPPLAPRA
jgi:hypothetical protein